MARLFLVVLGKQGAGKGTQCDRLSARHGVPHVSTGDILRAAVQAGTPLGRDVAAVLEAGALVSDDLVNQLVAERLAAPDAARGALFDGYPRTLDQARSLDAQLGDDGVKLCVNLDIPTALVSERLSSRRVCEGCGATYTATDPDALAELCHACGGRVVQRADDRPEAIAARLAAYERDTAPLLDYYATRGLLVRVDGSGAPDEVTASLEAALAERGLE